MGLLYSIGESSPILLFATTCYLLYDKSFLFFYYVFGFIVNFVFNTYLKGIIKQPRPQGNIYNLKNSNHIYGMPSGHSQEVWYSLCFIHLALNNTSNSLFYLIISLYTVFHRVFYNYHTLYQVLVGSIIGVLMGKLFYKLFEINIHKKISYKKQQIL